MDASKLNLGPATNCPGRISLAAALNKLVMSTHDSLFSIQTRICFMKRVGPSQTNRNGLHSINVSFMEQTQPKHYDCLQQMIDTALSLHISVGIVFTCFRSTTYSNWLLVSFK